MQQSKPLSQSYRDIAERHLLAAKLTLDQDLSEIAAFHCYHAFESICCSALANREISVPRDHASKLERFRIHFGDSGFARQTNALVSPLRAIRNRALYPSVRPNLRSPKDAFSSNTVSRLLVSVEAVVGLVVDELVL
jgi:hypothetical protein